MTSARAALALFGVIFIAAGAYVAATADRLIGLAILIVGASLLFLPLTSVHED